MRPPSSCPFSCTWPWSNSGLFRIAVELGYPFRDSGYGCGSGTNLLSPGRRSPCRAHFRRTSAVTPAPLTPLSSSMTAGATLAEAVVEAGRSSNILRGSAFLLSTASHGVGGRSPWPSGLLCACVRQAISRLLARVDAWSVMGALNDVASWLLLLLLLLLLLPLLLLLLLLLPMPLLGAGKGLSSMLCSVNRTGGASSWYTRL